MRHLQTLSELFACLAMAAACSPAIDWREWQLDDTGLKVQTPCKPTVQARDVVLAGATRSMTLRACRSHEHLFALSWFDVPDPGEVDGALRALSAAAANNIGSAEGLPKALRVPGSTPQSAAGRWGWAGRLPDGRGVQQDMAVFARGLRIYQAGVVASVIEPTMAASFFGGLAWPE